VGTDLEEAALMESVIESIAQTFKNIKKFSENVPTINVVVPGVQPASMTEVVCVLCVCCVCVVCVLCAVCVVCVLCVHGRSVF